MLSLSPALYESGVTPCALCPYALAPAFSSPAALFCLGVRGERPREAERRVLGEGREERNLEGPRTGVEGALVLLALVRAGEEGVWLLSPWLLRASLTLAGVPLSLPRVLLRRKRAGTQREGDGRVGVEEVDEEEEDRRFSHSCRRSLTVRPIS